jgi:hypothetical protein
LDERLPASPRKARDEAVAARDISSSLGNCQVRRGHAK